jgi:hypothetical protein
MASKVGSNSIPVQEKGVWEHTVGRLSNALRIPVNMIASIFQTAKIIGKIVALPVTYSVVGLKHLFSKNTESYRGIMSLDGIAINTVCLVALLTAINRCVTRTLMAPEKTDPDFLKGLKSTVTVLVGLGVLRNLESKSGYNVLSIGNLFKRACGS